MIRSKFNFWAVIPLILSLILFLILIAATIVYRDGLNSKSDLPIWGIAFVFAFFILWLVWGELRTKAIKIWIESDSITTINFLGFGASNTIQFSEIEGYKITLLPAEYQDYEYLYLFMNNQKAVKISEFYHKNYLELKKGITKKCKHLGTERFNLLSEIKEIFK